MRKNSCGSCSGFGYIRLPTMVWEKNADGVEQSRWVYKKVKCAACYVQVELGL